MSFFSPQHEYSFPRSSSVAGDLCTVGSPNAVSVPSGAVNHGTMNFASNINGVVGNAVLRVNLVLVNLIILVSVALIIVANARVRL